MGKPDEFGDRAYTEAVQNAVRAAGAGSASLAVAAAEWPAKGRDLRWLACGLVGAAREVHFRSDEMKSRKDDRPARLARAARLVGYVDLRFAALGAVRQYTEQQEYDRVREALRGAFDPDELASLVAEGGTMTEDRAVNEASSA